MNEAIGGAQNGHRYDQSFKEGNDRCHGDAIHAPRPETLPRTVYHMSQEAELLFVQPFGDQLSA
jgi:hypothetical protein